ncbi:type VI secretion system baseplate subunit TssE [Pseudomonas sp. GD03860]|uniref:type VI secretion system baseplate subunit TssE n=1 Tax=Pseudomonas TaxID=286 RepID=UPI00236407EA|nr:MULTISPECIES: type VI secretion system baseplate subunit TssE [Pseudomonas]MDD2058597.1 type VI secretion system baseplate subunit TssE [Pseudomonas putida]MDH0639538.1 type VI secretion system baseplate subunit TssE [Pseudomonas sp. GD03860]
MTSFTSTLLERLSADDTPSVYSPGRASKSEVLDKLRVDLGMLFNASGLFPAPGRDIPPYVARSVLNYGIGNIAGKTLSSLEPNVLEKRIRQAIAAFEPRIVRHSLHITRLNRSHASTPQIEFAIQGELRDVANVYPFVFRSAWNTESGEVRLAVSDTYAHHG